MDAPVKSEICMLTPLDPDRLQADKSELNWLLNSGALGRSSNLTRMLIFVCEKCFLGLDDQVTEHSIATEALGRRDNFDPQTDTIVRVTAHSLRKRLQEIYRTDGVNRQVHIQIPLGSYVPEFLPRKPKTHEARPGAVTEGLIASGNQAHAGWNRFVIGILSATALLAVVAAIGIYAYHIASATQGSVIDKFWGPLVNSAEPVLIVVGTGNRANLLPPEDETTSFDAHITSPKHHISFASAIALANVAGVLHQHGIAHEIKEDKETSLTDIHLRKLILIGARNNPWTMRLLSPMRFHFTPGLVAQILDMKTPQNTYWSIDQRKPYSSVSTDYAVVARYYDPTTEGPVMVIAGIGPYGTEAASAFVVTPQYLEQIARQLPAGWENRNIEMVLKTEVIDGKAGPPLLVSSAVW
jgi:hypothetical protein